MSLIVRVFNELKRNSYIVKYSKVIQKQGDQLSAKYSPIINKKYRQIKKDFKKRGIDFDPAEKKFNKLRKTVVSSLSDYFEETPKRKKTVRRKKKKAS